MLHPMFPAISQHFAVHTACFNEHCRTAHHSTNVPWSTPSAFHVSFCLPPLPLPNQKLGHVQSTRLQTIKLFYKWRWHHLHSLEWGQQKPRSLDFRENRMRRCMDITKQWQPLPCFLVTEMLCRSHRLRAQSNKTASPPNLPLSSDASLKSRLSPVLLTHGL